MAREETIAFCYLQRAGDERNTCVLMQEHLLVTRKGQATRFALTQIQAIEFAQRRWLLPLVAGGIVAPFSLLAIFLHLYALWPLFIVFLIASLLFYLGWTEHAVLSVQDQVKAHDFPLAYVSSNLQAFVAFARQYMHHQETVLYHVAHASDWQEAGKKGSYAPASLQKQKFIHASTREQLERLKAAGVFPADQPWVLLLINPLRVQPEIRYEQGDDPPGFISAPGELFPHIYGALNLDAVIETQTLSQ